MLSNQALMWIGFNILVLIMLALDLGVFHRKDEALKIKEALQASLIWVVLAIIFNICVYYWFGGRAATEFLTGYLLERSLSIDNIFVFLLVFSYFKIPAKFQYRVLFWGILGALIMRAALIVLGTALIRQFHWILYIFGLLLVVTGIRMALQKEDDEIQPEKNPVVRIFKRLMPVTTDYAHRGFFVKVNGRLYASLLFIVLLVVETTDLVFALDSIPAIFGVTNDAFIIYTSNVFAILGLRALYFALAGIMDLFHYLKVGLSMILVFIGIKMLVVEFFEIPTLIALAVIAVVLIISVIASIVWPRKSEELPLPPPSDENEPV
ncbi:MAG: TerC family protein [Acidobacteriota bacterium]